jgi:deoxyribonuclease-4
LSVLFGPAGNSQSFYEAGYKSTAQAPAWLKDKGLDLFEYSFGRGVTLREETGRAIALEAEKNGIEISVHAPYFINLAVRDEERRQKNFEYFAQAAQAASYLGARRMVFHPGSASKMKREEALSIACEFLKEIIVSLDAAGHGNLTICPETMGKVGQLGSLSEVIALCRVDERMIPTLDFGHLHARECGCLHTEEDFEQIIRQLIDGIGYERAKMMHVHFSRIEYTAKGEKQHRTYAETDYGPDFDPLARMILKYKLEPHIICESKGTMAEDAALMKEIYRREAALVKEEEL